MAYLLKLPGPLDTNALLSWLGSPVMFRPERPNPGVTILRIAGNYARYYDPLDEEVAAASEIYLGGREYVLTTQQNADLSAAGYGAYITTV